jgi:parvulin-like peptidyl-prolyl isomerase
MARFGPALALGWLVLTGCDDPKVVAEVGKREVTRADVTTFIASHSPRNRPTPSEALDTLVERSLLAEEARRSGLSEDPQLQARLAAAERELLAQALLDKRLAEATREEALRKRYDAHRAELTRREIHVRHILVRVPPGADAETQAKAQSRMNAVYARLLAGESFEKVASEASDDTMSAARGGDLGPVQEGQLDPSFFTEAAVLKAGERSKPFSSPYGLHLVEAVEDVKTVAPSFEDARGRLEVEARGEAQAQLLESLRKQIQVKTYPERLEAAPGAPTGAAVDGGQRP